VSAVAKRYAKALFDLAVESNAVESIGRELDHVTGAFAEAPLRAFAEDTTLDRVTRRTVAVRVSEKLGVTRVVRNFLALLAENNRLEHLPRIRDHYERFEDRALGRVRARVLSAQPLSDESRARIVQIFERQTGKRVVAETVTAPELLGGALVELQGRVFDGTLRTQLRRLQQSLCG